MNSEAKEYVVFTNNYDYAIIEASNYDKLLCEVFRQNLVNSNLDIFRRALTALSSIEEKIELYNTYATNVSNVFCITAIYELGEMVYDVGFIS